MGVPPKPPTDPADGLSCAQAWEVGVRKGLWVACPLLSSSRVKQGQADGGWRGEHNLLNLDYVYMYSEIHHPSHVGTKQW